MDYIKAKRKESKKLCTILCMSSSKKARIFNENLPKSFSAFTFLSFTSFVCVCVCIEKKVEWWTEQNKGKKNEIKEEVPFKDAGCLVDNQKFYSAHFSSLNGKERIDNKINNISNCSHNFFQYTVIAHFLFIIPSDASCHEISKVIEKTVQEGKIMWAISNKWMNKILFLFQSFENGLSLLYASVSL